MDGCHRLGFTPGVILSVIINALLLAYFVGGSTTSLQDIKERVGRLEMQWDKYLHEVRGVELNK